MLTDNAFYQYGAGYVLILYEVLMQTAYAVVLWHALATMVS